MTSDEVRKKIESLSSREKEVFELVCEELTYKEISKKLHMSESAVKTHMMAVRLKFGIDQLSRRKTAIELNNTFCSALKEIRDQSDKKKATEKESKVEVKPQPQVKEKVPAKELGIEKDKEVVKEKEKPEEVEFERVEKKDDVIPTFDKPKEPVDEKKDGNQMKKTDQTEKDRFRTLKTIWRVIAIAAIIFSGYVIYDRFIRPSPTEPAPSAEESGTDQEEVIIAEPEAIPAETVIVPTESSTTAPIAQPKPAILFEDDFEKGLSDAWEVVSGNPIVVNGTLSADQDTWLLVGDPAWTDYSVEFTTDLSYGWTKQNFNALGVLVNSIDSMYVFRWAEYDSGCFILENGDWNEVPQAEFTPKQGEKTFRITIEKGLFTVYLNGVKQTSFFDSRYSKGRIALKLFANNAIDNFKVREILE